MLRTLIWKEVVAHVLSLRFGASFVLFLLLVFASLYVTVNTYIQDRTEHETRVRIAATQLTGILAEKEPRKACERLFWEEGYLCPLPPAGLSWMSQGLQPNLPPAVKVRRWAVDNMGRGLTRNPMLGLLRVPDFVYIVSAVLSLLAILFTFDAVCGEKESGTLRLMLANSVPRHQVLLGKWIGGYLVLLVPFLIAVAGGLAYAWARGVLDPAGSGLRITMLVVTACIYIAAFFNITLFVSTTTTRSATSLLICLFIWVIAVIVLPNLAPVTARILDPAPPRRSIEASKAMIDREIWLRRDAISRSGTLSYGNTAEKELDQLERERLQRHRQLDLYLETREKRQLSLAQTIARISPAACWTLAGTALTGTDFTVYQAFLRAREACGKQFHDYTERVVLEARKSHFKTWERPLREDIPSLHVTLPSAAEAVSAALNDILILLVLTVFFFMLAFVCFLRYDVR